MGQARLFSHTSTTVLAHIWHSFLDTHMGKKWEKEVLFNSWKCLQALKGLSFTLSSISIGQVLNISWYLICFHRYSVAFWHKSKSYFQKLPEYIHISIRHTWTKGGGRRLHAQCRGIMYGIPNYLLHLKLTSTPTSKQPGGGGGGHQNIVGTHECPKKCWKIVSFPT